MSWLARALLLLVAASHGPAQAANEASRPPIELAPSAAERKAVRGSWAPEPFATWEMRELEGYERTTFTRAAMARLRVARGDQDGVLPPGFTGSWQGTGDDSTAAEGAAPAAAATGAAAVATPAATALADPDLEMRWDAEVGKYIEYLTKDAKGRSVMASLLRRKARREPAIAAVLARENVPRDLIYVGLAESALDPRAQWGDGTSGPWRLSLEAARAQELEVGFWVDGRREPELAATAAARRLRDLHVRFGSWPLALAAHRVGPEAVTELVARLQTNDYEELRDRRDGLSREALLFVARVMATALIGRNLAAFGFDEGDKDAADTSERVSARAGTTLATLARAASVGVEALRALNPELVRDRTPPDRETYPLRVPPGTGRMVTLGLAQELTPADEVITHFLRVGESLDDLAGRHGISSRELRKLNGVRNASELRGGVTVLLPTRAGARGRPARTASEEAPMLVAVPKQEFSYPDRERVFYRVCDGDTVDELAAVFKLGAPEIVAWNNLDPGARLHAGMVLQLFVSAEIDRSALALLDPDSLRVVNIGSEEFHDIETAMRGKTRLEYTARAGDTLNKIARRYGLASGDLARINRFSWNNELSAGQKVIVYSPRSGLPRELAVGRTAAVPKRPGTPGLNATKAASAATRTTAGKGARAGVTLTPVRSREAMAPKAASAATRGRPPRPAAPRR